MPELNFSGFPVQPESWWEGKIESTYGPVSRRSVIELLSEYANASMDDYEATSDKDLLGSYEHIWETIVLNNLNPWTGQVKEIEGSNCWLSTDAIYPDVYGIGKDADEAYENLELAILKTHDCKWIIR